MLVFGSPKNNQTGSKR